MLSALLASYYICDAAAAISVLDHGTVARCIAVYQDVKAQFLTEEELAELRADPLGFGGARGRDAYLRFTAWQEQNPELVARMRAEARARLAADAAS